MWRHEVEALEPRTHLAVLADASTIIPGIRGTQTQFADFDGDGIQDAISRVPQGWVVDLGRGDGTFAPASARPVVGAPKLLYAERLVLGRWTPGDDTIDIAVIRDVNRQWSVRVWSNDGDGSFTAHRAQAISGPRLSLFSASVGEVRRAEGAGSQLLWSYANGLRGLSFNSSGGIAADRMISTGVRQWTRADFALDGNDELLVSRALIAMTAQIAQRNDAGGWSLTTLFEGVDANRGLYAGDLDGDDRPDIGWARGRNVTLIRNTTRTGDAAISFAPPAPFITLESSNPADPSYFTDADRSLIIDAKRFDDGQPPAVIVQTLKLISDRIPRDEVQNYLLRPQGDANDRTWSVVPLSGRSGYSGTVGPTHAERLIDIGGDGRADLVLERVARRNLAESDIRRPVIGSLVVTPFDSATGDRWLIASDLQDLDGEIRWIEFYHDSDDDGQWSASDRRVPGRVTTSADGRQRQITLESDYAYGSPGVERFFARAWDDDGLVGEVTAVDLVITGAAAPTPAVPGLLPELAPGAADVISTTSLILPIATADFTGDGRPDLLQYQRAAGTRAPQLVLLVGRPPRASHPDELRFFAPRLVADADVVRGVIPERVLVGRFTSGNELDIVFTRQRRDYVYELVVLVNDGTGRFAAAEDRSLNRYLSVATPFAADGAAARQSFVALTRQGGYVSVRLDDRGRVEREQVIPRNFRGGSLYSLSGIPTVQAADFDGDGRDELIATRGSPYYSSHVTFQRYTAKAGGGFSLSPLTTVTTPWFGSFRIGDVDGDGTPDLVVIGARILNNVGGEAWVQVHRVVAAAGQVQVVEAREIFRDQFNDFDVLDEEINILGIGDTTGDGVADVTIELLTVTLDSVDLRAIVIQTPWSTQGQPPQPHVWLRSGSPAGTYVGLGVVFRMGDVDGDGVLDLLRRDRVLEVYRGG